MKIHYFTCGEYCHQCWKESLLKGQHLREIAKWNASPFETSADEKLTIFPHWKFHKCRLEELEPRSPGLHKQFVQIVHDPPWGETKVATYRRRNHPLDATLRILPVQVDFCQNLHQLWLYLNRTLAIGQEKINIYLLNFVSVHILLRQTFDFLIFESGL